MMTTTPIIIPVSHEPDRCPKCHEIEDIKNVCRNCGYEYREPDEPWWYLLIVLGCSLGAAVGLLWAILTCFEWFMGTPLLRVFEDQWEWLTSLRLK